MFLLAIGFGATAVAHLVADIVAPWIGSNFPSLKELSLDSKFFWMVVVATTIGLALSHRVKQVYGVELIEEAVALSPNSYDVRFHQAYALTQLGRLTESSDAAQAALRLNEWLADPLPGGDDWFEISNTNGTLPVVLTGLHVSADAAQARIDTPSAAGPGQ